MNKLYARIILLLLPAVMPAMAIAQCTDSARFKVNVPYCIGTAASFSNLSTGSVTGYAWNFGDPSSGASNTSTLSNPNHSFSSAGTYNVCLLAKYANAICNDTFCAPVIIDNPPVALFSFAPGNQCSGTPVEFLNTSSGNGLTYSWDFGDPASGGNNTSVVVNPQHVFTAYGAGSASYNVRLVAINAGGCTDTIKHSVPVQQRPNASLSDLISNFNNCPNASPGNPAFSITVTNTSTTNAVNTNYSISWGDGSPDFNSTAFTSTPHTYNNLGVYTLTFAVTGSNSCTDTSIYKVINISNPAIGLSSQGSTSGCAPRTNCFAITAYQQNDITTIYHVNFGDGSPMRIFSHPPPDTVCHTYTATSCGGPGNQFTARITAINACESTSATVSNIKIFTPPVTGFTALPDTNGCVNQSFTFLNTTSGGFNNLCSNTTTFTWSFGDGSSNVVTTSTGAKSHTYAAPGLYWVTLSASNYCSAGVVDSQLISVHVLPPTPVITRTGMTLYCSTDSSYNSYQWYVDSTLIPGATDSALVISHGGNYSVIVNTDSCNVEASRNVVLGVEKRSIYDLQFTIAPNPAGSELRIRNEADNTNIRTEEIEIHNIYGMKIYSRQSENNNKSEISINVSSLPAGIYFLQIKSESGLLVKRFVKE